MMQPPQDLASPTTGSPPLEESLAVETIELIHDHLLELHREPGSNVLRVLMPDKRTGVSITITAQGLILNVTGGDLRLQTEGTLAIDAERLSLHGRKGVAITTDGDAEIRALGDIHSEGRIQNIRATPGGVNIRANDDVKLTGERIRLNT